MLNEPLIGDKRDPKMAPISTSVPARLDRLRWSRFHTLVVVALGVTWILDGLEVTLAGSMSGALKATPACIFRIPTSASPQVFICWARS
jgi:hypothetical protein